MGELLKLILCCYVVSLIFSIFGAFIKFVVDTSRWHDREKKAEIFSSQPEASAETSAEPLSPGSECEVTVNVAES